MTAPASHRYKSTESKYKGGAQDMYVTYDVSQATRAGRRANYPKVKRVYVGGKVTGWKVGDFENRAGRQVHGVKIEYEQSRAGYGRKPYAATRGSTRYKVAPAHVGAGGSKIAKVVEVPDDARNIHFHAGKLPAKYRDALQAVR